MTQNPFPGPQPFRATDRAYFHGREDLSRRLEGAILVHRAVVVHGPSGSGKSSLIQASVLPNLRDAEDVRVVHLDGWPPGEDPTHWLSVAMHSELRQGSSPADLSAPEAVLSSLKRAVRGSSRILVICIDQLEQLFYSGRDPRQTEEFFDCVNDILELPLRTLRVVMSLREDYLGVFRDRLRDHRRVLGQGFRVGPLSVAELTECVCQTAASGAPPQVWSLEEMRALMMQVRVPGQAESDDAEAQAAYGQIVCRALFQEQAAGQTIKVVKAEPILQGYLETTLTDLGPLRKQAELLLEDHLVSADGGRTLRTEKELRRFFSPEDLQKILSALEGAAILHAASHQGSRYFEIGHDWLARKVFEKRQIREQEEERERREKEQAEALAKVRKERKTFLVVTVLLLVGMVVATVSTLIARAEREKAEKAEQEKAREAQIAKRREIDARDASILSGVRELASRGKLTWAMKLLPEVAMPAKRRGWVALASDLLASNALQSTLEGHSASLTTAVFAPDGKRILTASIDGTARIWDPAGEEQTIVLSGHTDAITFATWSHDGKYILTASADGTAHISEANGKGTPVVLSGAKGPLTYAEFSPDDARVVTASQDGFVRIHSSSGNAAPIEIEASKKPVHCAIFHPDGTRIFFSTHDGLVGSWDGNPKTKPVEVGKHEGPVTFVAASPDKIHLVSTSADGTARIWNVKDKKPREIATIKHDGPVNHAAFSPDGSLLATASADRMARGVRVGSKDPPFLYAGHTQAVTHVAFEPKAGHFLATASQDGTGRIFRTHNEASFVLRGHDAAVRTIAWNKDGSMLVTAAGDGTDRSPDETARIWSGSVVGRIGIGIHGALVSHSGFINTSRTHLVTVHGDEIVRVIHRATENKPLLVLPNKGEWVASASISHDGQLIATASFDKLVRIFHLAKPSEPIVLAGHEAAVRFAMMSPDGTRVLSGGDDSKAIIFSVDGKSPPVKFDGHRDWLTAGAWSSDGKRVVTASFDHTARVWNADGSGKPVELAGHRAEVLAVAFFEDGNRIVTASADFTARIWTPGEEPRILQHDGAVSHVAISPDDKLVATYARDHLIRIWHVDSNDPPIELEAAVDPLVLIFDKGGQKLVAIHNDGTVHAWRSDVNMLRDLIVKGNADCLPPPIRTLYLNESTADAEARYLSCKKTPHEMPWFAPAERSLVDLDPRNATGSTPFRIVDVPTLKELGQDMVRVKVIVLPSDADVEIDGIPTSRRQGVVEFVGKVGQERKLHVQRGAKHRSFDIKIGAEGALPARVDLNDKPAGTGPARPSSTEQPKPGNKPDDDAALRPPTME